jgi:hypothetical protein
LMTLGPTALCQRGVVPFSCVLPFFLDVKARSLLSVMGEIGFRRFNESIVFDARQAEIAALTQESSHCTSSMIMVDEWSDHGLFANTAETALRFKHGVEICVHHPIAPQSLLQAPLWVRLPRRTFVGPATTLAMRTIAIELRWTARKVFNRFGFLASWARFLRYGQFGERPNLFASKLSMLARTLFTPATGTKWITRMSVEIGHRL